MPDRRPHADDGRESAAEPPTPMSRTTHVCAGCGAELRSKRDLETVTGAVYASWRCRDCGPKVPSQVAEKLKHQRQH